MSKIYTSIDQLIGKTPLLELRNFEKKHALGAKVLAKLEYFNPAGSVKDRIAKAMQGPETLQARCQMLTEHRAEVEARIAEMNRYLNKVSCKITYFSKQYEDYLAGRKSDQQV